MNSVAQVFKELDSWMSPYIKAFYSEDEAVQQAIRLKEEHTRRVLDYSRQLAAHFSLNEHDSELAALLGLLHDVGRFRQFSVYHTFVDARSEDHAELGLKVIDELEPVKRLNKEDYELLRFAIGNHNKKEIAGTNDKRQLFFARFIRDVDKLDIYYVLEPFLVPSDGAGFADGFVESFATGEQVDYRLIRTLDDRKLVRLMWIYDVNFSWTMQRIVERGYIDKIINNLPQDKKMQIGFAKLRTYVEAKLGQKDLVSF